jgi:Tfp pilus assembly protein PilN
LLSTKIKALDKLIQTIDKAKIEKDLPKIIEENEKYL